MKIQVDSPRAASTFREPFRDFAKFAIRESRSKEDTMIRIKVQYDAINRTFKLVDQEYKTLLEGDALYDLDVPLVFEEADVEELVSSVNTSIAHA